MRAGRVRLLGRERDSRARCRQDVVGGDAVAAAATTDNGGWVGYGFCGDYGAMIHWRRWSFRRCNMRISGCDDFLFDVMASFLVEQRLKEPHCRCVYVTAEKEERREKRKTKETKTQKNLYLYSK